MQSFEKKFLQKYFVGPTALLVASNSSFGSDDLDFKSLFEKKVVVKDSWSREINEYLANKRPSKDRTKLKLKINSQLC